MQQPIWQEELFEPHRGHLRLVAYRMLGSRADAEDAVQEAWIRVSRARSDDGEAIDNVRNWLTTVVGRVCIDMMRSGRTRRETYIGTAVPDVIETDSADGRSMFENPETTSLLADSVGLAMLVVLETLSPSERLAMVLHDIFAVPFDVIAPMIGRTPAATRQLASRARRRARGVAGSAEPDLGKQRRLVEAFLAATRAGDFEALLEVLDPGAVFHTVTGHPDAGPALIEGAHAVANQAIHAGSGFAPHCRLAIIDGRVGMITQPEDTIVGLSSFTFTDNRIASIELTIDPDVMAVVNARVSG